MNSGGYVYRSLWSWISKKGYDETTSKFEELGKFELAVKGKISLEIGPWRANAGGLSVSRTFGDFEAKFKELGGTPGVIICEPEIFDFVLGEADFIVLGCFIIR